MFTERTPRVVSARKLHRRAERAATGRFLVEGAQAVGEALAAPVPPVTDSGQWGAAGSRGSLSATVATNSGQEGAESRGSRSAIVATEVFVTAAAARRHRWLLDAASDRGARISTITDRAAAALSETVTPQGIFAVCPTVDVPLANALRGRPRLVAVLVGVADPGNAGTVIRVADAAGADAVVLAGDGVDPHNGKCVRASAGSLFHVPLAVVRDPAEALAALREAGLRLLAAHPRASDDLETVRGLDGATAWVFGSEAHGLAPEMLSAVDDVVAVPIYGRAESLNLATAAAVCLYRSAAEQRSRPRDRSASELRSRPRARGAAEQRSRPRAAQDNE
jgi:TrmH family RNA methyltransferase